MILERFLTRLARSSYREKFVLKGGTLLAKYIPIGRETQYLDFLIHLGDLDASLIEKAVQLVFHHRKTPLKKLPIAFRKDAFETLEKNWSAYRRKIKTKKNSLRLLESIKDVISVLNQWLEKNASF